MMEKWFWVKLWGKKLFGTMVSNIWKPWSMFRCMIFWYHQQVGFYLDPCSWKWTPTQSIRQVSRMSKLRKIWLSLKWGPYGWDFIFFYKSTGRPLCTINTTHFLHKSYNQEITVTDYPVFEIRYIWECSES